MKDLIQSKKKRSKKPIMKIAKRLIVLLISIFKILKYSVRIPVSTKRFSLAIYWRFPKPAVKIGRMLSIKLLFYWLKVKSLPALVPVFNPEFRIMIEDGFFGMLTILKHYLFSVRFA